MSSYDLHRAVGVERGRVALRQRLYTLQPTEARRSAADGEIRMQIFRLSEQVEAQLRAASGDAAAVAWDAERDLAEELLIPGCDVFWRRVGGHFEGEMATASANSKKIQKPSKAEMRRQEAQQEAQREI